MKNSVSASSKNKSIGIGEVLEKVVSVHPNVYHGVASPLLFKTVYYTSGHRDYKLLEFLVLKFGPILAWYRFPAAKEFVVIFDVFFI